MYDLIIKNAYIVNAGTIQEGDVAIKDGKFVKISGNISDSSKLEIDACEKLLMPGIIDDQVHFREPGLTHKADIASESKAAVAGGVTSYMEMPNTRPTTTSQVELEQKYAIAESVSPANYSFYMGATNDNLEEVLRTDIHRVCGIKVFMGSSTGNMLVDDEKTLSGVFKEVDMLIATHCEDEHSIRENLIHAHNMYGEEIPFAYHPIIRDEKACFLSSSKAVELAKKYNARLHVLHISTEEELALFTEKKPLKEKRITAEVCVHHLYYDANAYHTLGSQVKCNPAIKHPRHSRSLWHALMQNTLDIIATDHAPHTWEEKSHLYDNAPSGLPLVQHAIHIMLDFYHRGMISLEQIANKMSHAPATCFQIDDRGYIAEGYWADAYLLDVNGWTTINKDQILYKCRWSPLEGNTMPGKVLKTIVNGQVVWDGQVVLPIPAGQRLEFRKEG